MAKDEAEGKETAKKGGKNKIVIGVVLLLVLGGVYKFVLAKPAPAAAAKPTLVEGEGVLATDSKNINLQDGALLRIGITLQLTDKGSKLAVPPDPGKAYDSEIDVFSGLKIDQLQNKKSVAKLKADLLKELQDRYTPVKTPKMPDPPSYVFDVYFTDFVVQAAVAG